MRLSLSPASAYGQVLAAGAIPAQAPIHPPQQWNDLKVVIGWEQNNCNSIETQSHIFEECEPIRSKLDNPISVQLEMIFGSIEEQRDIIGKASKKTNER